MATVNLLGSVASIVGFTILILGMVDTDSVRTPETKVWQYALLAIAMIVVAAAAIFSVAWVKETFEVPGRTTKRAMLLAFPRAAIGVLLLALAADGVVSAMNWIIWFW